ncbi:DUF397 domain-containing protein [Spirillospora sp. NPDC047418]
MELAESGGRVWVRDSKDPDGERLAFGRDAFAGIFTNPAQTLNQYLVATTT